MFIRNRKPQPLPAGELVLVVFALLVTLVASLAVTPFFQPLMHHVLMNDCHYTQAIVSEDGERATICANGYMAAEPIGIATAQSVQCDYVLADPQADTVQLQCEYSPNGDTWAMHEADDGTQVWSHTVCQYSAGPSITYASTQCVYSDKDGNLFGNVAAQ